MILAAAIIGLARSVPLPQHQGAATQDLNHVGVVDECPAGHNDAVGDLFGLRHAVLSSNHGVGRHVLACIFEAHDLDVKLRRAAKY